MRRWTSLCTALLGALGACKAEPTEPLSPQAEPPSCTGEDTYPDGAVDPMALGEVLQPYRWPQAGERLSGETLPLDLADAPCAQADDIDWSPFDVLLFVSIPAW